MVTSKLAESMSVETGLGYFSSRSIVTRDLKTYLKPIIQDACSIYSCTSKGKMNEICQAQKIVSSACYIVQREYLLKEIFNLSKSKDQLFHLYVFEIVFENKYKEKVGQY